MKGMKRKVLCSLILGMFLGIFLANQTPKVFAEDTITRGQWMNTLVTTFDMTIEDGIIPDDYYGDITGHEYYDDILIAINFGVVDLEPGEDFRPDDPVTREFAAQTLNYCLGYKLDETVTYTMSDVDSLTYPMDAQVAVDRGWFALIDGAFSPETPITAAEQEAMLKDAETVWNSTTIDPEHVSTYTFAEGVLEVTNGTYVEVEDDGTVYIYDTEVVISEGDTFAVYQNNIALTYNALSVTYDEEKITIETEEVSYDDAVEDCDVQETLDVEISDFVPEEGVVVTDIEDDEASNYGLRWGGTKKLKGKRFEKDVKLGDGITGKVIVEISNLQLDYKVSPDEVYFELYGDMTAIGSVKLECSETIRLGGISVAGVGDIGIYAVVSASGEITMVYGSNFVVGFQCDEYGFRFVKNFYNNSLQIDLTVKAKVGVKLALSVTRIPGCAASASAEIGLRGTYKATNYTDGNTPEKCVTMQGWLYAELYAYVKVFDFKESVSKTIYDYNNSPVKVCYHIEDGLGVEKCSRNSSGSGGHSNYYTSFKQGTINGKTGTVSTYAYCGLMTNVIPVIYNYELDENNNATLTKYNGYGSVINIPKEIDGYTVTKIGDNAFNNNQNITYVMIPDTVTEIGYSAFYNCKKLSKVEIPDSVTIINGAAFSNCTSLVDVDLPSKLVTLYYQAFYKTPITKITIPKSLENIVGMYSYTDGDPFGECAQLKEIEFEEGITKIPDEIFYNCTGLEEVVIPDTVTEIGYASFYSCDNLTKVEIPDSVIEIKGKAFCECQKLTDINLPKKLVSLHYQAFYRTPITKITVPKSLENIVGMYSYTAGDPFSECTELKEVKFEEGITKIPDEIFYNCTGLEEVVIPDTVTEIGYSSFESCDNLTKVEIPDSVTEIKGRAFAECQNLIGIDLPKKLISLHYQAFYRTPITKITIPKSLENIVGTYSYTIGDPFSECTDLKEVKFEEGITKIPDEIFYNCTGIEEIEIPDTVTEIGAASFEYCDNLTSVKIPDSVAIIGEQAFFGCEKLFDVDLPKKLVTLRDCAFYNTAIIKITIPKSLINVDGNPFKNCDELKEVIFEDGISQITNGLFSYCTGIEEIVIPDTVTEIGAAAFGSCHNLYNVKLNSGLKRIDRLAFSDCISLKEIVIPNTVTTIEEYAFSDCTSLMSVTLPEEITVITYALFNNCTLLAEVNIPDTVTAIQSYAFFGCSSLPTIDLSKNINTIGEQAFYKCTLLTDITFSDKLTIIGQEAFRYCNTLESIVLPDSLTNMGSYAFANCELLSSVEFGAGIKTISSYCFYEDPALTSAILPRQLETVESYAFANCAKLADVTINKNVTSINNNSFSYPAKMTIHGVKGTYAEEYATANSINFSELSVSATEIRLNATKLLLAKNKSFQLTAAVIPANSTDDLTFTSTDEEIITVDEDGYIEAVGIGEASVIVMAGDVMVICDITVYQGVSSVYLDSYSYSMGVNEELQLEATVYPEDAYNKKLIWKSSDESVVTVDENGLVKSVNYGEATITVTAEDGGAYDTCTIYVEDVAVEGITLNTKKITLDPNDTYELVATITPENATNKEIKWTSSNTVVATVENGVITAHGEGTAIIIAKTVDGNKTASCTVTVNPEADKIYVTNISISDTTLSLKKGDTATITATVTPDDATNKTIKWSSSDTRVVTVDNFGKVTAIGTGSATLTCSATDESGVKATCQVTVTTDVKTGWVLENKSWYYYNTDGTYAKGWKQIANKWYYFNSSGIMQTGWELIGGKWYYLDSSGIMKTGWQKISGKWYYLASNGVMLTNWQKIGSNWYYLKDGIMVTGWQKIGTKWYYFNASGVMQIGWEKIGTKWYYFNSSGAMLTGWQKIGTKWYYFEAGGAMVTGTKKIGSVTYKFDANGVWIQ